MANLVASRQIRSGDRIDVGRSDNGLKFQRIDEGLTRHQIHRAAGIAFAMDEPLFDDYRPSRSSLENEESAQEFLVR
jgi:hypothetical protein